MPLEYGSMDSESSLSPSSSERTVEGVGGGEGVRGGEIVGSRGDGVPITVVEMEGRRERGYDIDADIVEEVKQYRSELGAKDSLGHLVESYEIFSRVLVRPTGVEERACSAPRDHWMPVYAHYLLAGLRFSIPKLLVDDTEWERGDTKVEELASWKAKRANQNKFSLNEDEEEEVGKFLNTAGGVAIPKKPRKKSKTSTKQVDEGGVGKEIVPSIVAGVEEEEPELQLKRKSREKRGHYRRRRRESKEGAEVRAPGKGKGPVPPFSFQSSLFEVKNMTGARRFINTTFLEVDKRQARDEALRYCGASVVKHVLESASWVNGLAQEFMDSVKKRSLLQRQCDQLQKEKEELEKKNKELQEALNEVVPTVKQLEQERASLSTKLVFEESKRKIFESECEAQAKEITLMKEAFVELKENVQMLVHNGMKEHINNFISSSSFDNIVNLYRLPTTIIAFTNCRKKVKAEYPEVDITKITFGEQEEGVEENDGRVVFPPKFDFEFVAVEEEGAEVDEDEVEAGVEGTEVDESQPVPEVEIHLVPSDDEQPPLPDEQQPTQPPLPAEE
ncbi:hypothetical protein SLEP1_g14260 [Rubroshorea leprosula]|uniref:Uncharacterized protein n=1 Tax=Rubroshorea leprosula TaxID=152421 RepID=A0AAV5IU11_9ROSI|nr:hypothetical protein SLEP1_g14260 [Rubroshorea leprosula]